MRRFTSVVGTLLSMLWLPVTMMAGGEIFHSVVQNPAPVPRAAVTQSEYRATEMTKVFKDVKLKAESTNSTSEKSLRSAKKLKPSLTSMWHRLPATM